MPPTATKVPFATASPAELREAILPESREAFDEQFRAALDTAGDTLRLDELNDFLEGWRRTAWMQVDPERYRAMIAMADYINRHGQPPPGTKTYTADESRAMARRRLAELGQS